MNSPTLRAVWRPIRLPLAVLIVYLALHAVLTALSARHGFGSPDGLGLAFTTTAATVVVLRMLLLTVIPAVLIYRVTKYVLLRLFPAVPPHRPDPVLRERTTFPRTVDDRRPR